MIKFLLKPVFCLCLSLVLVTSPPVCADDDVKRLIGGLAVGIVGQMLDSAEQNQQEQQSQQQKVQPVASSQPAKPKLTYDADVADAQEKLKQLGHYDGVIDGLKGGGTTSAIKAFEASKGYDVDGELSQAERDVLTVTVSQNTVETDEGNNASDTSETPTQTPQNGSEKQIKDIEELSALTHVHNVCSNYRDLGNAYSFAVRHDFDSNYNKVSKLLKKRIKKQAKCLGIDDVELRQRRADKAYEESDDGKTIAVGIAGAIGGLNSPDSASEYCNMTSGASLIASRKLEKEVFNKETCKYE